MNSTPGNPDATCEGRAGIPVVQGPRGVVRTMARVALLAAGVLMLFVGIAKLSDMPAFRSAIAEHRLLTGSLAEVAAPVVPIAEVGLGILGVLGCTSGSSSRAASLAALGMSVLLLCFMSYAAILWIAPPPAPVDCGCGFRRQPISDWGPVVVQDGVKATMLGLVAARLR